MWVEFPQGGIFLCGQSFLSTGGGGGVAGLREGGRLWSTFRLFLREHAGSGGGGGYRIMIVM